jgi:UDP-2,3-diacylglucosamine hydrolase
LKIDDAGLKMCKENNNLPSSVLHLPSINEGALFIADAHYPHHGDEFLELLQALDQGEITTPQLFLMGDIFDLLFGYGYYTPTLYPEAIGLLNKLSEKIEIIYLEGNHDFTLKKIFPNIKVIPRTRQPLIMRMGEKRVALSHGDRYGTGWEYDLFSLLLRSPVIYLGKPWEKRIIDAQMRRLSQKKICHKMENFERKTAQILFYYPEDIDLVIEGHFHQAKRIGRYISLPALACQKELGIVQDGEIEFISMKELLR